MIHPLSISTHRTSTICAPTVSLIDATDEPTIKELEAGFTQSAKGGADENPLAIPLSSIDAVVPEV